MKRSSRLPMFGFIFAAAGMLGCSISQYFPAEGDYHVWGPGAPGTRTLVGSPHLLPRQDEEVVLLSAEPIGLGAEVPVAAFLLVDKEASEGVGFYTEPGPAVTTPPPEARPLEGFALGRPAVGRWWFWP